MDDIDWTEIAPKLIGDVADELMPDRTSIDSGDDRTAYGTRGSFVVDKRRGQFFDFEEHVGGGLFGMIKHITGMETNDAFKWLTEKGFLDSTYQPKIINRPKSDSRPVDLNNNRYLDYGKRLWKESVEIPFDSEHPVRKWSKHRNLLPDLLAFPRCIRYHKGTQYIITAMAGLQTWLSPNRKAMAFQVISIDDEGNKRLHFDNGTNDKRCFGKSGGHGVIVLGDPQSETVNICEGLADGLAIFSRTEGMVIITVTTIVKLNKEDILNAITDRNIVVWADNDDAGYVSAQTLMQSMDNAGMSVEFVEPRLDCKDPADASRHDPFNVDKTEFQRRIVQFQNRPEPEREAFVLCHNME